jgi:predicted metal-dependent HD superfamily phosphohydrolase
MWPGMESAVFFLHICQINHKSPIFDNMNYQEVKRQVLSKLKNELSPSLHYHNYAHTLDVIRSVEKLSAMEAVNGNEVILVQTAALFHDAGYLWAYDDNEQLACSYARELLPGFGYSSDQIETISQMIMATQIPQQPGDQLAMILCDADLDYIGRDDFFPIARKLYLEWSENNERVFEAREWYARQFLFFRDHQYFTRSAKALRQEKKIQNLGKIEQLLSVFDDIKNIEEHARMLFNT